MKLTFVSVCALLYGADAAATVALTDKTVIDGCTDTPPEECTIDPTTITDFAGLTAAVEDLKTKCGEGCKLTVDGTTTLEESCLAGDAAEGDAGALGFTLGETLPEGLTLTPELELESALPEDCAALITAGKTVPGDADVCAVDDATATDVTPTVEDTKITVDKFDGGLNIPLEDASKCNDAKGLKSILPIAGELDIGGGDIAGDDTSTGSEDTTTSSTGETSSSEEGSEPSEGSEPTEPEAPTEPTPNGSLTIVGTTVTAAAVIYSSLL